MRRIINSAATSEVIWRVAADLRRLGYEVSVVSFEADSAQWLAANRGSPVLSVSLSHPGRAVSYPAVLLSGVDSPYDIHADLGSLRSPIATATLDLRPDGAGPRPEYPAAARWAASIHPILISRIDPRTLTKWSHLVFASPGTLRTWCSAAEVTPRRSLLLARLLRAIRLAAQIDRPPEALLDVVDRRTFNSQLREAGLDALPADWREFLERQKLVENAEDLTALRRLIEGADAPKDRQEVGLCASDGPLKSAAGTGCSRS